MIKVKRPFGYYDTALGIIGRTGENDTRTIDFDCTVALTEYPDANIICVCLRPGDDEPYTIPLSTDGEHRILTLASADLEKEGRLTLELRMVDGDKVLKSARFTGTVTSSLQGEGDAPGTPVRDTLDRLDAEIKAAQAIVDDIRAKLDAGEFNGTDGYSPTATVSKDGATTTISITDKTGTTTATVEDGAKGDKGDPGSDANVTAENVQSALGYMPVAPTVLDEKQNVLTDADKQAITKAGMTSGAAWTSAEQKAARDRMGIPGNFELLHSITIGEGGVTKVNIPSFPALYHVMALVTLPPIAPFGFFLASYLDNSGKSYVAGAQYGNASYTLSIRFEIGIEGGIVFARSCGSVVGWGGGTTLGPNNAGQAVSAQSITSAYLYTPIEGKVIPEATKIEIYGVKI